MPAAFQASTPSARAVLAAQVGDPVDNNRGPEKAAALSAVEERAPLEQRVAVLSAAVESLSTALHQQRTRVMDTKQALVDHCEAMLKVAQNIPESSPVLDGFLEHSVKIIESIAEHGRAAEEVGGVLGTVATRLEEVGLGGVVKSG